MKEKISFYTVCVSFLITVSLSASGQVGSASRDSSFRPRIHFSPPAHWVNDPNGMVYNKGVYHLFYQHHPYSSVWGPMHWGHATSKDLINWEHQPIALYPDSLGTIFSGSAVLDENNTSGFGKNGEAPLVAIFTQHDMVGERSGKNDFQTQGIAYSNDNGKTWIKYSHNPILKNPGIKDFRDPKVMWHEPSKKWIMSLAVKDRISFYSSPDLKNWVKESDFGEKEGAHGGVWECPDLFVLDHNGKKVWVLFVSINPGGPNGGSATQYFLGEFDGHKFVRKEPGTNWIDFGPDNYAGVTWSNTGSRKIFLGWMSNWIYANEVPTASWRNAMTIPRELKLRQAGNSLKIVSMPVDELKNNYSKTTIRSGIKIGGNGQAINLLEKLSVPCTIDITIEDSKDFELVLSNDSGKQLKLGFDRGKNQYYIDRTGSGDIGFHKDFAAKHVAPRFSSSKGIELRLLVDASSIELFADGGLTSMTSVYFADEPYSKVRIFSKEANKLKRMEYIELKSVTKDVR